VAVSVASPLTDERDDRAIKDFWRRRTGIKAPAAARFHSEHDPYDTSMLARLCRGGARVLDLGCGTCVIANALVRELRATVRAVDYVPEFLEHALDDPRLTTEVGDARTYRSNETFDLIISLGVITYMTRAQERRAMYENCAAMLAPGGAFFLKAQFGIEQTVMVDTYSQQLGSHYVASYPRLIDEVALMASVFGTHIEVVDPFPPELNVHEDTHFHYLVAR
jgi:2-polyprenyl-3-methyl-5-hydroxy-6-metoxy-1,4-benzoquinol methylase